MIAVTSKHVEPRSTYNCNRTSERTIDVNRQPRLIYSIRRVPATRRVQKSAHRKSDRQRIDANQEIIGDSWARVNNSAYTVQMHNIAGLTVNSFNKTLRSGYTAEQPSNN